MGNQLPTITHNDLPESSESLLKKHLTAELFDSLVLKSTSSAFTLENAIRSAILNPDSSIGIYAGDSESYSTFAPLLTPIIAEYHSIAPETHQMTNIGKVALTNLDPQGKYIISSRVRVARNLTGYSFPNHIEVDQRRAVEQQIVKHLLNLKGRLQGNYHSLETLDPGERKIIESLGFQKGDRFQEAAGFNRDFPQARGVFHTFDKQLRVWINEEDHLRIICQDNTSDLARIFNLFSDCIETLDKMFDFAKDPHYGYLTSCPTNIGTSMRAGVHIRLEKLSNNMPLLDSLVKTHDLQIRGTRGEKTEVDDGIFDISNSRRFGISEIDIIKVLHRGLNAIIDTEKTL